MASFGGLTKLAKVQLATFVMTAISNCFIFLSVLTPSWQVAEDTDVGRSVQSGLWIYCPGAAQCWYIFSDDLINYYERVDVCRFFLIGDCRKKLLRTPYFFGWHYAVLIMLLITLLLTSITMVSILVAHFRPKIRKTATAVMDASLFCAFLLTCISLTVFMINAEMLESRYLIGVKNTFEKSYGYSFYLAGLGLTVMLFAVLGACLVSTSVFFMDGRDVTLSSNLFARNRATMERTTDWSAGQEAYGQQQPSEAYHMMHEASMNQFTEDVEDTQRYRYTPSEASIPTRTFLSY